MALGCLLAVAPRQGGRWLGLTDTPLGARRALGAVDVALGVAILGGRSSSRRWMAVATRALLHLLFAREYVRNERRNSALAMCALFVLDSAIANGLRRS